MFPTHEWYDMWDLYSWWQDLWDRLDRKRTSKSSWQATGVTTATAMAEDVDRPKEKPRPPAGGKKIFPTQARINFDTGGFKLNSL